MRSIFKAFLFSLWLLLPIALYGQVVIKGTVADANTGETLIGASVLIKGTSVGSISDIEGFFVIRAESLPVTLVASYVGFQSEEVIVQSESDLPLQIQLKSQEASQDLAAVGSRFVSRSIASSPVPIDNISAEELQATGKTTLAEMLSYTVPSFNSSQQAVSDATAHFDPADLRGLGPSRTLVLVNGKRKNASALVYINDTPGKGEVGIDWRSIPLEAIERVEVLRDGASAQYGSDAIAGVINIVLKDGSQKSNLRLFSGTTTQGDGFELGYQLNAGIKLGNRGSLYIGSSFHEQKETNRAGKPGKDDLFGVEADNPWIQQNPDLGMRIGQPNMTVANVVYNVNIDINGANQVYSFGNLTYRTGKSYALYRAPYWPGLSDPHFLLHSRGSTYQGFQPTFETDILDNSFTLGSKGEQGDWKYDASISWGSNEVGYEVGQSLNPLLGPESPTTFNPGGYQFGHFVSNIDIGRKFGLFSFSTGTEFRNETFEAIAGTEPSFIGPGAQSFPGLSPLNAVQASRYNVGVYAEGDWDISSHLVFDFAARYEQYSDFGSNFSWKTSTRYTPNEKAFLRGSISTGFRAPSLHQIYLSTIQTLATGGSISNQGTFNNLSPIINALEVPKLKEENSFNIGAGMGFNPNDQFSITADYYRISVNDRIVFTSSITSNDPNQLVGQILETYSVTSIKFFANAINTLHHGLDIVASYHDIPLGKGTLKATLSANFNKASIEGKVSTPQPIADAGVDIFDRKEQSRVISARPNHKIITHLNYQLEKWRFSMTNTRFGSVTWQHASDAGKDQTLSPKIITDVQINCLISNTLNCSLSINNLFNVYPDKIDNKGDIVTDLGGRFQYGWEVNQFGFKGTNAFLQLQLTF